MKIDFKQAMAKLFFSGKTFIALFAGVLFVFLSSSISYAPTKIDHSPAKMSDSELSEIDAQAFFKIEHFSSGTNFWTTPYAVSSSYSSTDVKTYYYRDTAVSSTYNTASQNVIRITLGMDVEASVMIESQKMGYRYGLQGGGTSIGAATYEYGWDLDITNFWVGGISSTGDGTPLTLGNIYLDVGFDNIGNATTRQINYIEVGSQNVSGTVTQTINRINGLISDGGTGQNNGVMLRQTAAGSRTVTFNHDVLAFVFASKYRYGNANGVTTEVEGVFLKLPNYHNSADLVRP